MMGSQSTKINQQIINHENAYSLLDRDGTLAMEPEDINRQPGESWSSTPKYSSTFPRIARELDFRTAHDHQPGLPRDGLVPGRHLMATIR